MKNTDVKERIIDATIALIEENNSSIESITIRNIATKAGVGIGLINYHFQSKENLINQCVQKMIGNIIVQFSKTNKNLDMEPLQKLRFLVKANCDVLAKNQAISRISMLSDLASCSLNDNTSQTTTAYLHVIRQICKDEKDDNQIYIITHIMISTIQETFLRNDVLMQKLGIDFFNKEQRDKYLDRIINTIFTVN